MLDDRTWDENTILTIIAERRENPFTLKETTESLEADWEATAEVLNQNEALRELLHGWQRASAPAIPPGSRNQQARWDWDALASVGGD